MVNEELQVAAKSILRRHNSNITTRVAERKAVKLQGFLSASALNKKLFVSASDAADDDDSDDDQRTGSGNLLGGSYSPQLNRPPNLLLYPVPCIPVPQRIVSNYNSNGQWPM
jgi:hypothetical protein